MINVQTALFSVLLYVLVMFLIAYFVDKKVEGDPNSKIVDNPFVYCLSLAVYCTSWTFYGSVGKASNSGLLFLTIYLGSTLMVLFWGILLKRLIRVKQNYHITSIVDFLSARYDKSSLIGWVGSLLVLLATIPYLALQFKALVSTFSSIVDTKQIINLGIGSSDRIVGIGFAIFMTTFTILFGIRKIDPTERHPGMIFVLAIECVFKLIVFLIIGIFCCYYLNDGFFQVLDKLPEVVGENYSFMGNQEGSVSTWISFMILSGSAILFLPRQFHVAVIENSNEDHVDDVTWGLPFYLFLINIFVIPISIVGLSLIGLDQADRFVLKIPMEMGYLNLSLLTFLGGFAAASGMIMVSTMTVTVILSNSIYLPIIERLNLPKAFTQFLLPVRWVIASFLIFSSLGYMFLVGDNFALVSMGMVSFAGVLQFAPAILGGLFWKKANSRAALFGLSAGVCTWLYTLYIPAFIKSGYFGQEMLANGLFGIHILRPQALFGLDGMDPLSHSVFWSMFFNLGSFLTISLLFKPSKSEEQIISDFSSLVDIKEKYSYENVELKRNIPLEVKVNTMLAILEKYYDWEKSKACVDGILKNIGVFENRDINILELFELTQEFEKSLTGIVGAATAHQVIQKSNFLSVDERGELYQFYSESLAEYNISPKELHTRINFYKEKEVLMQNQFQELERIIDIRTKELQEKNTILKSSLKKIGEMQHQLISREKMASVGLLASGLAHEIKNPLNFIQNGAKIITNELSGNVNLGDEKSLSSIKTSLRLIDDYSVRIDNIVKKMLNLSQQNDTEELLNISEFCVEAFLKEIELCERKYFSKINYSLDTSPTDEYLVSRTTLEQVLSIVIDNSAADLASSKKDPKEIHLKLFIIEDKLNLRIRDNGNGISDEILKNIFEPFVTTKQSKDGAGLGLTIANDLIRSKMGSISILSEKNKFTEVQIELPLKK